MPLNYDQINRNCIACLYRRAKQSYGDRPAVKPHLIAYVAADRNAADRNDLPCRPKAYNAGACQSPANRQAWAVRHGVPRCYIGERRSPVNDNGNKALLDGRDGDRQRHRYGNWNGTRTWPKPRPGVKRRPWRRVRPVPVSRSMSGATAVSRPMSMSGAAAVSRTVPMSGTSAVSRSISMTRTASRALLRAEVRDCG